ncbi:hypothetical protein ARMGADRAFT_1019814 [Armillaria gallica]|uniref:Uncharacterized protein n=1 Tax=Armillaria gallica TaxID=47427 RepID=A0A2H3CGT3_ARMGA|nr:hypothetical protein ARMGADRAFT_1019814 [Armillaria gallica]
MTDRHRASQRGTCKNEQIIERAWDRILELICSDVNSSVPYPTEEKCRIRVKKNAPVNSYKKGFPA